MTENIKIAAIDAVQKWKEYASERTEHLIEHAYAPGGGDPRFMRVLGPSLQTYQNPQSCAEYVLEALLHSIESTYSQHIAKPQEIVDLALTADHPREWERSCCRFTLDGVSFHVYTPASSCGIAIGLGSKTVSRLNKKMRAKDCAEVIRAIAETYPLCEKAVEEIMEKYGCPQEIVRKRKLISDIKRAARENSSSEE